MKALSKKLNGLVNLTIISLPLLLCQLTVISYQLPARASQLTVKNHDEVPVQNSPLLPSTPAPLPCIDSSSECIELLAAKAIANSPELVTLDEQIALIDERLVVAEKRIDHTSKKRWTNYISSDPLRIAANILGGGDVQRDNIAIADLEVKSAELEAYRANLHRRKAEVKSQLREEVLALVLEYEAAEREYVLAQSKLATYQQQRQLIEIDYQYGNGSTTQMLSIWQQGESLEVEIMKASSKRNEVIRKLVQLSNV
jgi:hypothetical protein